MFSIMFSTMFSIGSTRAQLRCTSHDSSTPRSEGFDLQMDAPRLLMSSDARHDGSGIRRSRWHGAFAALAAIVSLTIVVGAAPAGAAPVDPSIPATDEGTSVDGQVPSDQSAGQEVEIVQSWTLTPGGGQEGDDASNRPDLTYQVAPGTTVSDTVIVYNYGNVPMLFRVYATDAFNNADGQFDLIPGAEVPSDAGSWVSLVLEELTLAPGKQATIPFTLQVPIDATPGDHVGAIVAANVVQTDNGDGQIVNVERRTGTRLYVQVDGPLNPELAVVDLTTDYHHAVNSFSGSADITFTIENRGNVRLGGAPTVSMSGPFGLGKKSITLPDIAELLPGETIDLSAELTGVPALFLDTTTVSIDAVDRGSRGDGKSVISKDRSFVPPVFVMLLALAILLGVLARRAYLRRRRASTPIAPIAEHPPVPELSLTREPMHR
jgi:hypothetical protein